MIYIIISQVIVSHYAKLLNSGKQALAELIGSFEGASSIAIDPRSSGTVYLIIGNNIKAIDFESGFIKTIITDIDRPSGLAYNDK